jgi:hypothetical protein
MGYEKGIAPHSSSRKGSLGSGVTATNHNDIEVL